MRTTNRRGDKKERPKALSKTIKAPKKTKKQAKKLRSPSLEIQEDSESRTLIEVRDEDTIRNEEEDTATTSEPNPTRQIPKVSTLPSSSIPTSDIFNTNIQDPFMNLTITPPPPPPVTPPTTPITLTIPISSIPPLPPMSYVGIYLPQISIPLTSTNFIDSTTPNTSYVSTPPEDPIVKSFSEATRTSDIPINASDAGANVYIGVTLDQGTSPASPFNEEEEILFGDNQEPIFNFVFNPFTINLNNDDDDAPMTKGQFKKLDEKLDSLLESSTCSSSSKWE